MIDREWLKRAFLALATRVPLYKLLRNERHRDYLAVQYLNRVDSTRIPAYLATTGRLPTFRYSTTLMALNALDREGDLLRMQDAATRVLAENPEKLKSYFMLSDTERRKGEYQSALEYARAAWMLQPGSLAAATRAIRLGYITGDTQRADQDAIAALQRFGDSDSVLWLACKYCRSPEQLQRIMALARLPKEKSRRVSALARPLAAAALRSECFGVALELYAEACVIELRGKGLARPVVTKKLAGKGGSAVLQQLRETLESEGIPFFFAAGTALGLVRNGKPLDHDNDIDVGIFEQDWDREQLVRVFSRHPDFDLDDANPNSPKVGILHRGGASIDLFKFYQEKGGVYHDAIFVRWKNTPFAIERHVLESKDVVYLPENIDRYLTENYGSWRIPNKNFDAFVHGPNVETTWPEYMEVHRLRRAYKSIRESNLVAARHDLEGLQDSLMRTPCGRELAKEMLL